MPSPNTLIQVDNVVSSSPVQSNQTAFTAVTQTSSSVTFTSSSKTSAGGWGQCGILFRYPQQGLTSDGAAQLDRFALDTDTYTPAVTILSVSNVASSSPVQAAQTSFTSVTQTSSSVTFTSSSKTSAGGWGQCGILFRYSQEGLTSDGSAVQDVLAYKKISGQVHSVAATIIGQGAIFCSPLPVLYASATIVGQGTVTAAISEIFGSPSATIIGQGSVTASLSKIQHPSATIVGQGTVTASIAHVFEGSLQPTVTSSLTISATDFTLGSDYIWGIIDNETGFGSPDFVPIGTMSFSGSGTSAQGGYGPSILGFLHQRYAFGFSREASAIFPQEVTDNTRREWSRFNFYVDHAVDNIQISNSVGFSGLGISALGGDGILGRDVEKYVTFAVLTHGIMTQGNLEIIATGNPHVANTQTTLEMLWIPDSQVRNTQTIAEVLYLANLAAIQQSAVEVLADSNTADRHGIIQQAAIEAMMSIKARALLTQASIEGLQGTGNPNVNLTEVAVEVLTFAQQFFNATAVIQQSAVETLALGNSHAIIQQVAVEGVNNADPKALVNGTAVEAIHNDDNHALIQQVAVEEVNNSTTFAGVVQQVAIEMLIKPEYDPTVAAFVNNPRYSI